MAKKVELVMPKLGESIQEATILKWLKSEGDTVEADEAVLEIATDKVDSDVPAPIEGKVVKTMYNVDDVVKVGEPIAVIETEEEVGEDLNVIEDDGAAAQPAPSTEPEPEKAAQTEAAPSAAASTATEPKAASGPKPSGGNRFYSPLVRNIARQEGIATDELEQLPGSGKNGRVTKKDILAYIQDRKAGKAEAPAQPERQAQPKAEPQPESTPSTIEPGVVEGEQTLTAGATLNGIKENEVPVYPGDEIVEMDRMRKMISEHMVRSKRTSPHVTSFVEVDMTPIVQWREKMKKAFQEREGAKLTFTPIFIEAVVKSLKEMPGLNISVLGDKIVKRKHMNIGMATAMPSGHLIVPVVHDADTMNLSGLAKKVNDLAGRARENQLKLEEIQGSTFTITNVGTFGNVAGTPVINQPEVAILATGAIQKKPDVVETSEGDTIGIRHKMFLSMSYDHRVVDGALGGAFIRKVADQLEAFDTGREF